MKYTLQEFSKTLDRIRGRRLIERLGQDRDMVHGYPSEEAITDSLKRAQRELRGLILELEQREG